MLSPIATVLRTLRYGRRRKGPLRNRTDADEIKLVHPGGAELVIGSDAITLSIGQTKIELTSSEVVINDGMAKITTAGASLVNDAFKVGG